MSRRALFAVGLVALGVGWLASRPLSNRGDIWRPVARGEIVLSVPTLRKAAGG